MIALGWLPAAQSHKHWTAAQLHAERRRRRAATPGVMMFLERIFLRLLERELGLPAGSPGFDYVERTLERSTVNVLALMVTVAISVSVAGWMASVERTIDDSIEQVGFRSQRHPRLAGGRSPASADEPRCHGTRRALARRRTRQSFRLLKQNVAGQVLTCSPPKPTRSSSTRRAARAAGASSTARKSTRVSWRRVR